MMKWWIWSMPFFAEHSIIPPLFISFSGAEEHIPIYITKNYNIWINSRSALTSLSELIANEYIFKTS